MRRFGIPDHIRYSRLLADGLSLADVGANRVGGHRAGRDARRDKADLVRGRLDAEAGEVREALVESPVIPELGLRTADAPMAGLETQ